MIPQYLTDTIERFRAAVQADPRIAAAFVGGSLAAGTADAYSVLDIYVVIPAENYSGFFADREQFLRQLGEPVFEQDFNEFGFDMVLFHLADGTKGELSLGKSSDFLHIHGGAYQVVLDRVNLLKGIEFPLFVIPVDDQKRGLEGVMINFWRSLDKLTRALGRGHLLSAGYILHDLRVALLKVCRLSVDFGDGEQHYAEKLLPAAMQDDISSTFCPVERAALMTATASAIAMFQKVAIPLAQKQQVNYPFGFENVVLRAYEALPLTPLSDE